MTGLSASMAIELPSLTRQTSDRIDLIDEQQPSLRTAVLRSILRQARCAGILACFLVASFIAITVLATELAKSTAGNANKPTPTNVVVTATTSYSVPVTISSGGKLGRETKPSVEREPICYSDACYAAAHDFANYIASEDSDTDPCSDFYKYVCDNSGSHELSFKLGANALDTLGGQLDSQLRDRLRRTDDALQKLKSVRLAREFYATCVNTTIDHVARKSAKQKLIKDIKEIFAGDIQGITDAKNGFRLEYLAGLLKANENLDAIIAASISINLRNVSEYAIVLDQPALGLDDSLLLQPDRPPALVAVYNRRMRAFACALTRDSSNETSKHSDNDIHQMNQAALHIELDLAKLKVPQSRIASNRSAFYRATTLKDLLSDANSQQLNWTEFLRGYFGDKVFAAMQNDSADYSIVVKADSYFDGLHKLYRSGKYSNRDWQSYLIWRLALARKYKPDVDRLLNDDITSTANNAGDDNQPPSFEERPTRLSGRSASAAASESDSCLDYAKDHFAWALTRLLPNQSQPLNSTQQMKMELELIADSVLAAAAGIFTGIDWLDLPSKLNAERKQHEMVKHLMYPDWIFDNEKLDEFYDLPESGWKTMNFYDQITALSRWKVRKDKQKLQERRVPNRQQGDLVGGYTMVDAFYNPEENSITIPAPIVQPPFYRVGAPKAVNYGGIGFAIGHEVSHGYDEEGVQYFDNGTLYRWLDRSSYTGFNKMDKCIIDEYNGFCYRFTNNDGVGFNQSVHLCINGTFTQGENLADNAGVRAAWFALKAYENSHGPASRLPLAMSRFSSDQLFFLSLARPWCERQPTRSTLEQSLRIDPHSPGKWRVNGVLRNFKPFADVWHCKPGSPMAPRNHCHVW